VGFRVGERVVVGGEFVGFFLELFVDAYAEEEREKRYTAMMESFMVSRIFLLEYSLEQLFGCRFQSSEKKVVSVDTKE